MANETFLDASGATKYRKSTGAGSAGDPAVAHNIIDGTVTVTGAGGTFPVTDSGGSLTVDGTVAATQSGTWNVTNISGTISLPTGAATETTLQSANSFLTSIDASLADITRAEDAIHTSGDVGVMALVVRKDVPVAGGADGDYVTLGVNSDGRLYVTTDGTVSVTGSVAVTGTFWQATQPVSIASTVTVTGTGGTFPVTDSGGSLTVDAPVGTPVFVRLSDGTNAIATLPVSLASVPSHPVTNAGTFAVQVSSALPTGTNNIGDVDVLTLPALPTGSNTIGNIGTIATSVTPGTAAANLGKAEDAVHATGDVGVMALAVQRNTAASGTSADGDYATLNVDSTGHLWTRVGLALPAGSNLVGDVGLSGRTTGGLTLHRRLSTGTDSTNVKNAAGQLFWGFVTNTNASARYIKFYNSASTPTLGSGTPVLSFLVPPGSSGLQITAEQGLAFSTGIGYTLSTGAADADTGTVAASEIIVNLGYR